MMVDGMEIAMDAQDREFFSDFAIHANETFVKVVEQVRDRMDDADIEYLVWSARTAGDWPLGLWELLGEVYAAGLSLPDELLDEALEYEWGWGLVNQIVGYLRARNRDLAPA